MPSPAPGTTGLPPLAFRFFPFLRPAAFLFGPVADTGSPVSSPSVMLLELALNMGGCLTGDQGVASASLPESI